MSAAAAAMLMVSSVALGLERTVGAQAADVAQDPLFRELDVDRDGAVTRGEAARTPRLVRAFGEADENRDGRLSADEFVKARAISDRAALAAYGGDSLITAKVKAALVRDPLVKASAVGVRTRDGTVLLSGRVPDAAAAERARALALGVEGVVQVRDELVRDR